MAGAKTFDLDLAGRVTAVHAAGWTERYAYDEAGNQTEASWPASHPGQEAVGTRAYTGTTITRAGNVRYEHDELGRITLRQKTRLSRKPDTWRYEWDAEDHMRSVTTPDGVVWRYEYDALGRRLSKQRLAEDGRMVVERVTFTWDGTTLCEETTENESLPHMVALTWHHQGLRPLSQTERIIPPDAAQEAIDERFFSIVTDFVGTPNELIDERGKIAWRMRHTLWGTTTWTAASATYTPLRFPGQQFDRETGLHYNVHRYYEPDVSRYLSLDPLGLAPAPNPAAYVANPHRWVDPLGLAPDYPDLGDGWEIKDINDPRNWNGCEDVAVEIQEKLGGGTRYRISNAIPDPFAERFSMGPYRGADPGWYHHDVVLHEGRVYDGFTGRTGLPKEDYDALWHPDYLEILHWRPLD